MSECVQCSYGLCLYKMFTHCSLPVSFYCATVPIKVQCLQVQILMNSALFIAFTHRMIIWEAFGMRKGKSKKWRRGDLEHFVTTGADFSFRILGDFSVKHQSTRRSGADLRSHSVQKTLLRSLRAFATSRAVLTC